MSIEATCERAYQRGHGKIQVRSDSGRLITSAKSIEACEPNVTRYGVKVWVYTRRADFVGRFVWIARAYTKP